jgi:hypothetical protein
MGPEGEVVISLRLEEWMVMSMVMARKLAGESHTLSAAIDAALSSEEPTEPGLLRGLGLVRGLRCSSASARELLRWCEAVAEHDPENAAMLRQAARSIGYAMWRRDEGFPPDPPAIPSQRNPT